MSSVLLKCLECRLVGAPPVFNMPPPPAPPAEFLTLLNLNENKQITKQLKQIQLKRCLKVKNILNLQSRSQNQLNTPSSSSPLSSSNQINSMFYYLTPNQSLYIFLICLFIFLIVLTIAFIFLYKLYRLRKELKSTKSKISKPSCLSNSLSTETNTINSHLIITPSSSSCVIDDKNSKNQFIPYNLMPLYDSASTSTNSSISGLSKNTTTSCLFYNQLFESTRHLLAQNQQLISTSSSNSSQSNTPITYEHYLQAVPNNSNLIENHINYKLEQIKSKKKQYVGVIPSEYDEINSQAYHYDIYNQYDDSMKNQMIIQPIFPIKQFVNSNTMNSQGAFCSNSNTNMINTNISANNNFEKNLYFVC